MFRCDDYSVPDIHAHPSWKKLLFYIKYRVRDSLEFYNGMEQVPSFCLTVVQDAATLKNATVETVRTEFKKWCEAAVEKEHGQGATIRRQSQRYNFVIRVSEDVLGCWAKVDDDCLSEEKEDDNRRKALRFSQTGNCFVDLIWKDWPPEIPENIGRGVPNPWVGGIAPPIPEYEEIEGCKEEELGWMRVSIHSVVVSIYSVLRDPDAFFTLYRRPLEILRY
ncbi:hypothetical protein QBC38DRAFT_448445 [Podospora fimiseda]|uniref:Uncharacterized protein n=1 Tax=Podospora fimiseda TaxID=252190 RepID=A0AAN7BGN7_9PEZI|nr:hypothetical protein QBC38DRAFT_448445 [Podospora fimiseda]